MLNSSYQLGFVIEGSGKRVVGDSICPINRGEVVLLGANLPHVWRYDEQPDPGDDAHAIVIHFGDGFLGSEFRQRIGAITGTISPLETQKGPLET